MNPESSQSNAALNPRDIILILHRHRWMIICLTLLGFAAAGVIYVKSEPPYGSTAKLFVRFIMESSLVVPGSDGTLTKSVDPRGDNNPINTELEILGSWNLAQEVADKAGPGEVLGRSDGTNLLMAAAAQIKSNLKVDVAAKSSVISITYLNPRPEVARRVLEVVVTQYREMHLQAHSSAGTFDTLVRETDQMSADLKATQAALSLLKNKAGVTTTVPETKAQLARQIADIETKIIEVRTDLAQQNARLGEMRKADAPALSTNTTTELPLRIDESVSERYRGIVAQLDSLRSRVLNLEGQYTGEHPLVKQVRSQIDESDREKHSLEQAFPGLLAVQRVVNSSSSGRTTAPEMDFALNAIEVLGNDARLKALEEQLTEFSNRRVLVSESEDEILELEGRLQLGKKTYEQSLIALRGARFSEALDPSRIPNINVVQTPSAPFQSGKKRLQFTVAAAFAGLALGIALALARGLVFDQSIRSAMEIETKLHLPMFMSIPLLSDRNPVRLLSDGSISAAGLPGARPERAPWEVSHFIRPYCDALRDRLIMYFQLKNIHHKPKLVAITSCSEGAGTTTMAAGLAASLSETGDGKVLLVDMNVSRPEMHPFFRGNLASSLTELFQPGSKPSHGQYDNLYLATGTERNGEVTPLVPSKFFEMLPRMRSSDFDYIIFDMPAVKQTSATVALSGFMDKVLLLVEPGKTNRDAVKRATELMRQQHADVAGVVNRLPTSAMKWLQPDLA